MMEGGEGVQEDEREVEQEPGIGAGIGRGRGHGQISSASATGVGAAALPRAPEAGLGRGRGAGRGVARIGIGKQSKTNDLTKYFTSMRAGSSSSGSRPSTHGSGNATGLTVGEAVQETVQVNSVATDLAQVDISVEGTQPQPEEEEQEDEGTGLIMEFDPHVHIVADPALREPIERFHPNIRSDVRRAYLLRGPTQPIGHSFPRKLVGSDWRAFHSKWFKDYDWLEYSVSKDTSFCFYCFLFRQEAEHEKFGHVVFTKTGFNDWKHANRGFPGHVGGVSSCHNKARLCAEDFKNQRASITHKIDAHSKTSEQLYEVRLTAALDVASFLISQGHAFRGHDESATSLNKGNFLEMVDWYKKRNADVRVAFEELCQNNARMEMDHRFNEVSSDLLVSFACLDPRENFAKFDIEKIARLTEIYDQDFSFADRDTIRDQLETFIIHVRRIDDFKSCHDLGSLAMKMVETKKDLTFPLVYRIIELALILPVATSSVERAFSAMHLIKTDLHNKMCDEWLNSLLVCYIEKGIFKELGIEKVKKRFQSMRTRRVHLPKSPRRPRRS